MPERPVREILSRDTLVAGPPEMTVRDAAKRMAEHVCGSILVLDGETLVGIFTERDLLVRVIAGDRDPDRTTLAEVMTRRPDTIEAGAPVKEAIRRMDEFCYKHLPVVEAGRVIGVIAVEDIPIAELVGMSDELEERHKLAERMW